MAEGNETRIQLGELDPLTLYGVNNSKYNAMASHFSDLQIVARGEELMVSGKEEQILALQTVVLRAEEYYRRHGDLPVAVLEEFLSGKLHEATHTAHNEGDALVYAPKGRVVKARTPNQQMLVDSAGGSDLIFALGPAGTGKTYTAIALAVRALKRREVRRIILTRPAVEAGERLGFLPGDLKEKLDPYLQPLYDALNDMIPPRLLQSKVEDGTIQIAPLAYMRGRTLDDAYVILDEAQNATLVQMKMFLTRMGRNAKFIVTGDTTQIDLPHPSQSGLLRSVELVRDLPGVGVVEFELHDIVRHRLVSDIVLAFAQSEGI